MCFLYSISPSAKLHLDYFHRAQIYSHIHMYFVHTRTVPEKISDQERKVKTPVGVSHGYKKGAFYINLSEQV